MHQSTAASSAACLYFGKLSSATTNKVPVTDKGWFNPVIVFGFGAQAASEPIYVQSDTQVPSTAMRMTSGSNWRHLNRPEIEWTRNVRAS